MKHLSLALQVLCWSTWVCLWSLNSVLGQAPSPAQADSLVASASNTAQRLTIYNQLGSSFLQSDPIKAMEYANKAIQLATSPSMAGEKAKAILLKARVYSMFSIYDSTFALASENLALVREMKNDTLLASTYEFLAVTSFAAGFRDKGRQYRLMAKAIEEKLGQSNRMLAILINIGDDYREQQNFDSANYYTWRALEMSKQLGNQRYTGFALMNLGQINLNQGKYAEAEQYAREGFKILIGINNKYDACFALQIQGSALRGLKQYPQALQQLRMGLDLAQSVNAAEEMVAIYAEMSKTSELMGDWGAAFNYLKSYSTLRDSLFNSEEARQTAMQYALMEAGMVQSRYNALASNEQLLKERSQQQNIIIGLLLLGLGLAIALAIVMYNRDRQKKKTNTLLEQQNLEILRQKQEILRQEENIRRQNQVLEDKNKELIEINGEKNYLIKVLAHDLRNPLHSIKGLTTLLRLNLEQMTDEQSYYVESILSSVDRMNEMITKILNVEAIESKNANLKMEQLLLEELLQQVIWDFRRQAFEKHIEIQAELSAHVPTVYADKGYITQIFENLLSNAIKYSPIGKNVAVRLRAIGSKVRVEFQDEGPGLTIEDQEKLFGKYQKLSAKPTGGETSFGIGLSIVKKYVDAMQGKVWCESTPGHGANFIVELPTSENIG